MALLCQVKPFLHLKKERLSPFDIVAYALTADALVLGDLGKRKILIIIKVDDIALLVGQHGAIMIQQDRDPKIFFQNSHLNVIFRVSV